MKYCQHLTKNDWSLTMMIYQVLDEENNPIAEFNDLDYALQNAESLTFWYADHYYHVQEINTLEDYVKEASYSKKHEYSLHSRLDR